MITIDGKQIKLQIWDTVSVNDVSLIELFDRSLCGSSNLIIPFLLLNRLDRRLFDLLPVHTTEELLERSSSMILLVEILLTT